MGQNVLASGATGNVGTHVGNAISGDPAPPAVLDAPPSAPGTVSFTSVTWSSALVSWGAASDDHAVTGYRYAVDGGAWQYPGNVLSAIISIATPPNSHMVVVQAVDTTGQWGPPNSGSFYAAPSEPIELTAVAISATKINLNWGAANGGTGAYTYHIYRDGVPVGTATHPATGYLDAGLLPNTTYSYVVYARDVNTNTQSPPSNTASATTLSAVVENANVTVAVYSWQWVITSYGYGSNPGFGSYNPTVLSGGQQIASLSDSFVSGHFPPGPPFSTGSGLSVSGFSANPGAGWLAAVTVNGITRTGASASYTYSNGQATWLWNSQQFGLQSQQNNTIPVVIQHE